jgi:5-methylthioadenosine/S-adenosylhomocysteine deaminase
MTNNDLDMFEEMRQAVLLQRLANADATALPSRDVLRMATRGSAAALGLADLVGRIEVGRRADLAVVALDRPHHWPVFREGGGNVAEQVVWSCRGSDVRHTVVDGRVLMEDRRLLTLDLAEIADLVDREARDLLTKAGVLAYVLSPDRRRRPSPPSGPSPSSTPSPGG